MIFCYICNKDASAGWATGFIPAPDSQKLALCPEHDTPVNRKLVEMAWNKLLERDLAAFSKVSMQKAAPATLVATVHFTGGGMLSFTCTSIKPTPHGTLQIDLLDGSRTFLPMQHVREYSARPHSASE